MSTDVLILHGTYGSPDENWFPWLARACEALGLRTHVPALPTPEGQSLDDWTVELAAQLGFGGPEGHVGEGWILVGHSLGAVFAAHVATWLDEPVDGLMSVCGFDSPLGLPEIDALNAGFVCPPPDFTRVRANVRRAIAYAGEDDPYVPLPIAEAFATQLGTPLRVVPRGGHLNAAAGFRALPDLLGDIEEIHQQTFVRV